MRLWTAAQPTVSGYVRALVRDRAVADEVLQETSLVLFRRFDEYDERAAVCRVGSRDRQVSGAQPEPRCSAQSCRV